MGNEGKVYSVEPVSVYNKIFEEQARKYRNITLLPYALGNEEKDVELVSVVSSGYLRTGLSHVYNAEKDSSTRHCGLDPQSSQNKEIADQVRNDGEKKKYGFRVQSQMKLASVLLDDIPKINYIKIDIEGDEFVVLSDMKALIQRHKPIIQVEMNDHRITDLLEQLGYSAYQVTNKKKLVKVVAEMKLEGDCFFLVTE